MARSDADVIDNSIALIRSRSDLDDSDLADHLVEQLRVTSAVAWMLVSFVPMAYARPLLERLRVGLPDAFMLMDPDSRRKTLGKFAACPIFKIALSRAVAELGSAPPTLEYVAIAGRSAEYQVVNKSPNSGSRAEDLMLMEAVLFNVTLEDTLRGTSSGVEEQRPGSLSDAPHPEAKPWWRFGL